MLFIRQRPFVGVRVRARMDSIIALLGLLFAMSGWAADEKIEEAEVLFRSGQYAEVLARASEATQDPEAAEQWHLLLVESLLTTGQYPQAWNAATNAVEQHPRNARLRWLARDALLANGQVEAARAIVEEIMQRAASQPWAFRDAASLVVVGQAALEMGADPKDVLDKLFDSARQAEPELKDVPMARGELALQKHDYALAARIFQEALKVAPDDPDFHWGLARAYAPSEPALMIESLQAALELNSNHVGSLLLLADHSIDAEDYEQAEKILEQVLSVNPWHPDAWAYRAVICHLKNQPKEEAKARETALTFWPSNPRVDHLIGLKLSRKYRFAEGANHQYQALRFDLDYLPAKAQLAEDLLRLGREDEGWKLADEVQREDEYDVTANNLMVLHDVIHDFVTLTNEHFTVRMNPVEAVLYGDRALELLEDARKTLSEKYGIELVKPTLIEIFHEQKDFAVRTFGMPENHGFLGVCFGSVITANSPGSRPGMRFNWESMLWHEFAHVITLQLTGNKMPRWLSEGISVYEERQANPAWGERLTPAYREMMLGEDLTPVSELSAAFLTPPSAEHLQFAYYEASLVVEYLVKEFGHEKLVALLNELWKGTEINAAIERHIAPMAEVEAGFEAYARQTAENLAPGLDWEKPDLEALLAGQSGEDEEALSSSSLFGPQLAEDDSWWEEWASNHPTNYWVMTQRARDSIEQQEWDEAKAVLRQLIDLYPGSTGSDGAYALLAGVHRQLGETQQERDVLARLAALDDEALDAYARLMELGNESGDWAMVLENARRYLAVDPLVPMPYRFLARAAEELGKPADAVRAYRALLELNPRNPAEIHYQLARLLHELGQPGARRHVLQALEGAPRYREALDLLLQINADREAQSPSQPPTET